MLKLDLAYVEEISISQVSTDEIRLVAQGQLPDSCTKIEKSDVEHVERAIIVSIFTSRSSDSDCGSDPIAFNEEIRINIANAPGIAQNVIVNGISAKIDVLEQADSSVDNSNAPSPTPESPATSGEEEVDQSNLQDKQADSQATPTTSDDPSPTQVASVVTEQLRAEDTAGPTQTVESESTRASETAQPTDIPPEADQPAGQCEDKAAFYADVTIPDNTLFKPGDKFTKVWRVRNEGTCIWNDGYTLVFASGEIMNASLSNPVPVVEPGEVAEVSVDLEAPARWGQYSGNWQFQNSHGVRFGVGSGGHDYIWVQIFVDSPAPQPTIFPDEPPSDQTSQPPGQGSSGCDAQRNDSFEQQVLALINSARTSQGLNSLTWQPQLSNAAYSHSSDMACQDFVGHSGSDASSWYDRVSAQGYANYNSARENIYVGDPQFGGTPDGAYDWWMNSQVHRDNILNPDVAEIGIGYSYNPTSSFGGYYTVVFARP